MENNSDPSEMPKMLPPPPGSFVDREELIHYVGEFGVSQGYIVTIKQSKKDKLVMLGCDRGGVYRNRRKPVEETSGERSRKRRSGSRLTNCPFELMGKKDGGVWVLTIKNGSHNHEALKDITEHPSARRFTEEEVLKIKEMTESGLKPRQILKRLRQSNPELLSTPKHVYNVKTKIRQGNLTVRRLKTLRSEISIEGSSLSSRSSAKPSWRRHYPLTSDFLRFVITADSTIVDDITAQTVEIHPGVTKIIVRGTHVFNLSMDELDVWRFCLPAATRPDLATTVYSDGQLVVRVPKGDDLNKEDQEKKFLLKHRVPNLIGGRFVESQSLTSFDVINPATEEVVSQVPITTNEEFKAAVFAAKRALLSWRNTTLTARQRIMFKFQELIRRDIEKIALTIINEQGKTLKDARHEVLRGLELVELACGSASLQMGQFVSNSLNGADTYSIREPIGVCAGICPNNFPAMVPLWMFPIAVTCGNTFILKPSEKDPGACLNLAELAVEAGLPNGVLNVIHGTNDIINAMCDDEDIKAISFVGPDTAGTCVSARESAYGKRVQSNTGAKNHAIVMPDASMDATLNALVTAGFGAAGQRCMAISTVIFVGGSESWEAKLVERAKSLKISAGIEPDVDLGPVISKQAKEKTCRLIQTGIDSGARLVLDGRQVMVPNYERGYFIGPTILCDVTNKMACYKEETMGPVLLCMQADSLDEAIKIANGNKYGVGASLFTTSPIAARKFQDDIEAKQVGINVPVPAPLLFFSLTGSKASFSGDLNFYGNSGVHFYTQTKTVTQQWNDFECDDGAYLETPLDHFPDSRAISLASPSNDFTRARGVSLALQSDNYQHRDGIQSNDPLTLQTKDLQNSSRVPVPLQSETYQSSPGVSLTLHSRDLASGDEERQLMSRSHGTQ